jgi:methylenetetrahydrofolate--tRNA-(uracil-5-)-methyltransferase
MFFGSRYDKGTPDFINIPLNREQYDEFVQDLLQSEKAIAHDFEEEKYFESCMPIETIASRGPKTLSFGPMRPVGLRHPDTGERAHAVIQLRSENEYGTAYNLVGFQSKMKYGEQIRIFRKLPGMENAEFLRLGSIHRNTFINSPKSLRPTLQLRGYSNVFVAGQLTGTEGYLESTACGLVAGINAARIAKGEEPVVIPRRSMLGSLLYEISNPDRPQPFQPMNVNMGLLPPLEKREKDKKLRKIKMGRLANKELEDWLQSSPIGNIPLGSYTNPAECSSEQIVF